VSSAATHILWSQAQLAALIAAASSEVLMCAALYFSIISTRVRHFSGLRPDEAWRLEFRDVAIVDDDDLGETMLEIEVHGKRGGGYCKSMPGASCDPGKTRKARKRFRNAQASPQLLDEETNV
jgi:hypothetical protein